MAAKVKPPQKGATAVDALQGLDLNGRYILITGANSGIGFEAARALALHNANVTLGCRNPTSAKEAVNKILEEKGDAKVSTLAIDMSSLESVEKAADEYIKTGKPLHVLILNAGVMSPPEPFTKDGFEGTWQINYLSHYYLVDRLENKLIESAPSRIVAVSARLVGMLGASKDLQPDQITWDRFSPSQAPSGHQNPYVLSKLAQILHVQKLHERLHDKGVSAFSLHPGVISGTNLMNRTGGFMATMAGMVGKVASVFMKTPQQGALASTYCASAPGLEALSGRYFTADCHPEDACKTTTRPENTQKMYELTEQMIRDWKQKREKQAAH